MVRRKKLSSGGSQPGIPVWMITFSDLTTLLMTFFVLLVSMASMTDASKRKVALGSVSGKFGTGAPSLDDLSTTQGKTVEPGPFNLFKDLQAMKKRAWEDSGSDLHFEYNRFIQRLSIDADVLFAPGSAEFSPEGRRLLDEVRPIIIESSYPLGLSGHTAEGRDEFGPEYLAPAGQKVNFSWRLSLDRVVAVYRYFVDSGVPADKLRVEAFGKYRPKAGDATPAERKTNRRVDITLDKRVGSWAPTAVSDARKAGDGDPATRKPFRVRDYIFWFDLSE